jgi:ferredoxin
VPLHIGKQCIGCWACELVCPSEAIRAGIPHFVIDPLGCTECEGDFAEPQCASICPVEGAIIDRWDAPLNPLGSLTGILPEDILVEY